MAKITKREKIIYITFITTFISIFLLYIVTDIYAQYASTFTANSSIEIKNWKISVNDVLASSNNSNIFNFDILTSDNSTKVSPGSTGTFAITIKNDSNVEANYTMTITVKYQNTDTLASEFIVNSYDYKNSKNESSTNNSFQNSSVSKLISQNQTDTYTFNWKWESTISDYNILNNYTGFTIYATVKATEKL